MKKKAFIRIASFLMILIGILRGLGGFSLFIKGSELATNQPIIADETQIKLVAGGLIIICILLTASGILLLLRKNIGSWKLSVGVLILFLLGGLINGSLLFGQPVDQGQFINFIVAVLIAGLLMFGKSSLSNGK